MAPSLWFVWFVAIYALQGAGCAAGLDEVGMLGTSVLRVALAALTLVAAAAIAGVGLWSYAAWARAREARRDPAGGRPGDQSMFLAYGALLHAALFLVATVWIGIPILMTDACGP